MRRVAAGRWRRGLTRPEAAGIAPVPWGRVGRAGSPEDSLPRRRHASSAVHGSSLLALLIATPGFTVPAVGLEPGAVAPAAATPAAEPTLRVPPVPPGTPEEVIAFLEGLLPPKIAPASQEVMFQYLRDVSRVSVEAIDAILPRLKVDDPLLDKAAMIKLQGLFRLWQLGDPKSGEALAAFAASIAGGTGEAALEAGRMALAYEARRMFSSGAFDAAPAIGKKAADLLARSPDDEKTVGLVMQVVNGLKRLPDGGKVAAETLATCGPTLARSGNP